VLSITTSVPGLWLAKCQAVSSLNIAGASLMPWNLMRTIAGTGSYPPLLSVNPMLFQDQAPVVAGVPQVSGSYLVGTPCEQQPEPPRWKPNTFFPANFTILDPNGNYQKSGHSGVSGPTPPSWQNDGQYTCDNWTPGPGLFPGGVPIGLTWNLIKVPKLSVTPAQHRVPDIPRYPMYLGGPSFGFNNYSPAETVDINGSFGCDYELITSDGGGNLTAQSFNPVSDRNRKEQITPMAPANALAMALAMTNYTWRFKAHTNWAVVKIPTSLSTNLVAHTRTNKVGRILTVTNSVVVTNSFVLQTNVAKAFLASGKEFGPMAQDWHAATGLGGGTNISMTSEAGLLLGAVQGLAQLQGTFTNQAGARFALVVNAQTNGFIFVPQ
jgi:hypothetical protein